jgi:HD superfamily phosphohydrolase
MSEEDRKRPAASTVSPLKAKKSSRGNEGFQVESLVKSGSEKREMYTRVNDEVHISIDCCPLMQKIIDTWPMQRLRDIKQLGTTFLVYPCGTHTRFEHSIGVGHLARLMCNRLRERHTSYGVSSKDALCVTLAGLLHDTGHGPFSHLYEVFREEVNEELKRDPKKRELYRGFPEVETNWSHERSSLMMVDEVLRDLGVAIDMTTENLDKPLKQIGDGVAAQSIRCYWDDQNSDDEILTNRDWIFIKECIYGKAIPEVMDELKIKERIGRTDPRQEWLYDIVSNRHNGIDVDKVDYFARDQRRSMSEAGNIDISIINEACVAKAKCNQPDCKRCKAGEYHFQICYPKKCVSRVIEFFKTRGKLHEFIYQHKTGGAGECMLKDVLKLADPYYLIPTEDPNVKLPISRAFSNAHAFERMRDSIIDAIMYSTSPELQPARDLALKFKRRELYSTYRANAVVQACQYIIHPNSLSTDFHLLQNSAVKRFLT